MLLIKNEKQCNLLSKIDIWFDKIVSKKIHCIVLGIARKALTMVRERADKF